MKFLALLVGMVYGCGTDGQFHQEFSASARDALDQYGAIVGTDDFVGDG